MIMPNVPCWCGFYHFSMVRYSTGHELKLILRSVFKLAVDACSVGFWKGMCMKVYRQRSICAYFCSKGSALHLRISCAGLWDLLFQEDESWRRCVTSPVLDELCCKTPKLLLLLRVSLASCGELVHLYWRVLFLVSCQPMAWNVGQQLGWKTNSSSVWGVGRANFSCLSTVLVSFVHTLNCNIPESQFRKEMFWSTQSHPFPPTAINGHYRGEHISSSFVTVC